MDIGSQPAAGLRSNLDAAPRPVSFSATPKNPLDIGLWLAYALRLLFISAEPIPASRPARAELRYENSALRFEESE